MRDTAIGSLFAPRPPIAILGVPFDNVTVAEAIQLIEEMIGSRRPHYLVTPNVDFLVQAARDVELRRILFEAHLVVCDGTPLIWASRFLGNRLPERIAGSDLVPRLIGVAAEKGYRIFFLGAAQAAVERAVTRLQRQFPALRIAGYYSPPFAELLEMDHEQITMRILDAKPDLLFVAFGCPKQEKWIAMHYRNLGVPVTAGVGGTIDFLGGRLKRAPVWMQRTGIEWVFRLAQEPRRLFRRYARDFWTFGWNIVPQWWRMKAWPSVNPVRALTTGRSTATNSPRMAAKEHSAIPAEDCEVINLPNRLDVAAARQCAAWTAKIRELKRHWLLEMSGVEFIDSTGIGLLIQWKKLARNKGCEIVLVATTPVIERTLTLLRLQYFFLRAPAPNDARRVIAARLREQPVRLSSPAANGLVSLEWHGEITAANAAHVYRDSVRCVENNPKWLIDLSKVTFIDSSGIGLMIRMKKMARQYQADLVFTGIPATVLEVIRLAHLQEFLLKRPPGAP